MPTVSEFYAITRQRNHRWPNRADVAPEFLYYGEAGPPPGYYEPEPAGAETDATGRDVR
jgi:hypothetical protein